MGKVAFVFVSLMLIGTAAGVLYQHESSRELWGLANREHLCGSLATIAAVVLTADAIRVCVRKRAGKRFQFSLSLALVLSIATGITMWINLMPTCSYSDYADVIEGYFYGWPLCAHWGSSQYVMEHPWDTDAILVDAIFAVAFVYTVGRCWRWFTASPLPYS